MQIQSGRTVPLMKMAHDHYWERRQKGTTLCVYHKFRLPAFMSRREDPLQQSLRQVQHARPL
jgi:hypothetical protein